jgi:hypothetical protein
MANVNINEDNFFTQAGTDGEGRKWSYVNGAAKATQNDTLTLSSAGEVVWAIITDDTTGAIDAVTISGNVITLTGTNTGTVSGIVVFK